VQLADVDDAFQMLEHEVTNDQYYEFLLAWARKTGDSVPRLLLPTGWVRRSNHKGVERIYDTYRGDHPVSGIPYFAAVAYCAWFWEERLDSDPDRIVDLPSEREYLRAGRGDSFQRIRPWKPEDEHQASKFVLDLPEPLAVKDERLGVYDDLYALVGNVAEWLRGRYEAGWSHLDHAFRYGEFSTRTPFGPDGLRYWGNGAARADVGFRFVIRDAPALPEFREVDAGTAQIGQRKPLPPAAPDGNGRKEEPPPRIVRLFPPGTKARPRPAEGGEDDGPPPPPLDRYQVVGFANLGRRVPAPFDMARFEITNRQYLYFLASAQLSPREAWELRPASWDGEEHPFRQLRELGDTDGVSRVTCPFAGPWGPAETTGIADRKAVELWLYEAGGENQPVEGVTEAQVKAYTHWLSAKIGRTCRVPHLAEYLRAGRGNGRDPYPWGWDKDNSLLVCSRIPEAVRSPVSLIGRTGGAAGPAFLGLAGNVAEYVWDEPSGRLLIAGGHYHLPPAFCTLDDLWDAAWEGVEWEVRRDDDEGGDGALYTSHYPEGVGFRVVRERGMR
jgi:formylglycine-generating enzyme required for sulfatase activity